MLHFQLKVNNATIGELELTRTDPLVSPTDIKPDDICTYKVFLDTGAYVYQNTTEHRFGNGAWSLIHKAIGEFLTEDDS